MIDMGMQTTPVSDSHNVEDFSPKQIKQLSEALFPLFLDAMEKHIDDTINSPLKKKREIEEQKLAKQLKQLQTNVTEIRKIWS